MRLAVSSVTLNEKDSPDPSRDPGLCYNSGRVGGSGNKKQRVCFVVAAEVLVLHRLTWEIKTLLEDGVSRQLFSGICGFLPCSQTKLVKKLFANL